MRRRRTKKPREGERVCLLSGPRDELEANKRFYENTKLHFRSFGWNLRILEQDEEVCKIKVKRRILFELNENKKRGITPIMGESSILVADCRVETEQVYKDILDWTTYDSYMIIIQPHRPEPEFTAYRKSITGVILQSGKRQWDLDPLYETKIRPIQDEAVDPVRQDSLLVAFSRILSKIHEELTIKSRRPLYPEKA